MAVQYDTTTVAVPARYADLADQPLAVALSTEDAAVLRPPALAAPVRLT